MCTGPLQTLCRTNHKYALGQKRVSAYHRTALKEKEQTMRLLLIIEVIGYFGILGLQIYWGIHRVLTEQRFAVFQVVTLSLIMITTVLFYARPEYPFGFLAGSIGTLLFAIVGYPVFRWLYRQMPPPE